VNVQIYTLFSPTPYTLPPTPFLAAVTTVMFAAFPFGVTVGTGIAAIVLTIFFNRVAERNDAHARITGTFHRGYGGHSFILIGSLFNLTYEQVFMDLS
jgi:hypothetical protein